MPPTQTPCYLLISFRCHLILWKPASLGGIFFSRTALPDGAFRARKLAKATRPLTCTHFDPCQSPQFSLHLGLPCHWNCFCHIAPNRTQRVSSGPFIHFIQAKVRIVTQAYTTIKLLLKCLISHRFRALMMIVLLISLANPAE